MAKAAVEILRDAGTMLISEDTPSLVLKQKIRIDVSPVIYPGNNPGGNWKYAEMVINAEAPMVAFIGDPYPFFPQLQEIGPNQFRLTLWTNTPARLQGWAYVFDRPANEDAQYLALSDANGSLTYALGAKPMRIIGVGGVFPNGGMEEDRFPDFAGKTVAGVICAPATSTFQNSFTVMGIGNGQGVSGKHGLFGNAITIPKIGTGGSPNQTVVGIVMAVDATNY
ncbi:TPA: hypothetical protein ACKP89_000863 [Stenotrophomonas maltophilia]|uniref:hypothetical protein n=1 Tax=Stenotrophomonas maltophilia TaxID=40324 RepID=UPI000C15718C|nr:hypothetical protein [Stenotrophomonas maltophilia]MBA0233052.1 hypothetical protein [Stenotrophomonas maltophilia]MBA0267010.1 hypothetical protein [Stenotrophomonas maltophilia]MBA0331266.1 hypothetical protein [Stenotrophomonas maltophilia]MBN5120877.1 hypothetical protein [Stenotrophomonas maltophilia]MBO3003285.1 hypothetical protein [Stenotrophomonas maltophilia]